MFGERKDETVRLRDDVAILPIVESDVQYARSPTVGFVEVDMVPLPAPPPPDADNTPPERVKLDPIPRVCTGDVPFPSNMPVRVVDPVPPTAGWKVAANALVGMRSSIKIVLSIFFMLHICCILI